MGGRKYSKIDDFETGFRWTYSDDYLPKKLNAKPLFHYTSAESLNNILTDNGVKLWASQINCLNDKEEVIHVEKIYDKVCSDLYKSEKIDNNFYKLIRGIKPPKKSQITYNQQLPDSIEIFGNTCVRELKTEKCTRYISCFSTEKDSLPSAINPQAFEINYRAKDGFFIPYIVLELPKYLVSSIMIGPLTCSVDKKDNQEEVLAKRGYEHIDIKRSIIPIRY